MANKPGQADITSVAQDGTVKSWVEANGSGVDIATASQKLRVDETAGVTINGNPFLGVTPGLESFPADASTIINNAISTRGFAMLPRGTTTIQNPIVPIDDSALLPYPGGSTLKWTGANSGFMVQQSALGTPNLRQTFGGGGLGILTMDPGTALGVVVFDWHSPQQCTLRGIQQVAAADQTGTFLKIRADCATSGGYGNNKNAIDNVVGEIHGGKNGTFLDMAGALATSQVVTLNNFYAIDALNIGTAFILMGDFCDNNFFWGTTRGSLNQSNAIGWSIAASANTYGNLMQAFQPDTFAGKTGRKAVSFGAASSRNQITSLFSNPVAEGGSLFDGGASSWFVQAGDWTPDNSVVAASSAIRTANRNIAPITATGAAVYVTGGTSTIDAGLIGVVGTIVLDVNDNVAVTIGTPSNPSQGQIMNLRVHNSSGGTMGNITASSLIGYAITKPANGQDSLQQFTYTGTRWVATGGAIGPF